MQLTAEPGVGDRIDDPLVTLARAHLTFAVTVATSVLIASRLLVVASFRIEVAMALLASAGIVDIVIGTALTLLPYVAPILALAATDIAFTYYRSGRRALLTVMTAGAALATALGFTPVVLLLTFGGLLLFQVLRRRRKGGQPRKLEDPLAWVFNVAALPVIAYVLLIRVPWLPPEMIVADGSEVLGYVASVDGAWTHILKNQPRVMLVYKSDAVTSRNPCLMPLSLWSWTLGDGLRQLGGQPPAIGSCNVEN